MVFYIAIAGITFNPHSIRFGQAFEMFFIIYIGFYKIKVVCLVGYKNCQVMVKEYMVFQECYFLWQGILKYIHSISFKFADLKLYFISC